MGNHYHLLVETPEPNLSRGMRQINGDYGQTFNRRHQRKGHLFQGRFHAVLVEKETHLLELCRYVVLNPIRARMAKDPANWPWSSYGATVGKVAPPPFLHTRWILSRFSRRRAEAQTSYGRFVAEGLGRGKSQAPAIRHGLWIGSEGFLEAIRGHLEEKADVPEFRLAARMAHRPPLQEILSPERIADRRSRVAAVGQAYLKYRYSQREIADFMGVHYMTVSRLVRAHERQRQTK
jgi:hypothetical protein